MRHKLALRIPTGATTTRSFSLPMSQGSSTHGSTTYQIIPLVLYSQRKLIGTSDAPCGAYTFSRSQFLTRRALCSLALKKVMTACILSTSKRLLFQKSWIRDALSLTAYGAWEIEKLCSLVPRWMRKRN